MHEAGRVDFLGHRAASVDEELEGHELRLQVGREARIGFGDDLDRVRRLAVRTDEVRAGLDLHARCAEFVEEGREMRRVAVCHRDVAARDRAGDEVGAGFDAVGDDRVVAAMEFGDAFDLDDTRALAADFGAHLDEHRAEIDDLWFAGGAFDAGDAGRERGGHHDVGGAEDRAAHRAAHEDHITAGAGGVDLDQSSLDRDDAAEGLEAFQVEVDGAGADDAAARDGHLRLAEAANERAQQADRRAHLADEVVGRAVGDLFSADRPDAGLRVSDDRALVAEDLGHVADIAEVGHVAQRHRLAREERSGEQGQRGVLRTGGTDRAFQHVATSDARDLEHVG